MKVFVSWDEFMAKNAALLIDSYLGVLVRALTDVGEVPPKLQFDDNGVVVAPDIWTTRELPPIEVRVLPRWARRSPVVQIQIQPDRKHLGQLVLEHQLCSVLPSRLPSPFAGRLDLRFRTGTHLWQRRLDLSVAWDWDTYREQEGERP